MLDSYLDNKGKTAIEYPHFPTRMQAVVWRNWGLVPVEHLTNVLQATEQQVMEVAGDLGLPLMPVIDPLWLSRGYMTIIRANWHLLPYGQLLQLLNWSEEQLAYALKEDDFLWIKLGSLKPHTEPVQYRPLTNAEKEMTSCLIQGMEANFRSTTGEKPFDFLKQFQREPGMTEPVSKIEAVPGKITLDSRWTLVYSVGTQYVRTFAERFADTHERKWGIRLLVGCEPEVTGPVLSLRVLPDASLLGESHKIEVTADRIEIHSVDEQGLLRGLQWLASQMDKAGGPYLSTGKIVRDTKFDLRFIYSYFAVYGDPLIDPELDPYPHDLLERLCELGINGIWLQCVLYNLVPWKAAPELSAGWEKRIEGLRRLVERAASYGIGVYLYFNEPRAMPLSFFTDKPDWRGHSNDGIHAALCTSNPEVQEDLRERSARLFREVPGLAGLFTISMSENLTNCYSKAPLGVTSCPRCSQRSIQDVTAEVNKTIADGVLSENPQARILCWTWGWRSALSWTLESVVECIEKLPDGVSVMCTSEDEKPTLIAGIPGHVLDYSMSVVGPSEKSMASWKAAANRGLATVAKVQFNTTWESSFVPFLPVFDLLEKHLSQLSQSGVTGLMLSWSLGGYPSLNLELASEYYWETSSGKEALLRHKFGTRAGDLIGKASLAFSTAFLQFPFDIGVVYFAPHNYGPANLLHLKPTNYKSTMVGFPYDDLTGWRSIYPVRKFAAQFRKLSQGWKRGLIQLQSAQGHLEADSNQSEEFKGLIHAASAAYYHFRSTYLQILFVSHRDSWLQKKTEKDRLKLLAIIEEEIVLAQELEKLIRVDSRIGYEASNHYYYTTQDLREKVLNCIHLRNLLESIS